MVKNGSMVMTVMVGIAVGAAFIFLSEGLIRVAGKAAKTENVIVAVADMKR